MTDISLRYAGDADAEAYFEIINSSIRGVASKDYTAEAVESWVIPICEDSFTRYLQNEGDELRILAEQDGEVLGIGAIVVASNELTACYVAPTGLRRGVGTAIVKEIERIAMANDIEELHLCGTLTAEPFYNHLGYRSIRTIERQLRDGITMVAVEMSKRF